MMWEFHPWVTILGIIKFGWKNPGEFITPLTESLAPTQ